MKKVVMIILAVTIGNSDVFAQDNKVKFLRTG